MPEEQKAEPKIEVSSWALFQVLQALNGPGHLIRELQVTRTGSLVKDNPINILVEEYNEWYKKNNEGEPK